MLVKVVTLTTLLLSRAAMARAWESAPELSPGVAAKAWAVGANPGGECL